jgi:hypothetical protein
VLSSFKASAVSASSGVPVASGSTRMYSIRVRRAQARHQQKAEREARLF